MVRVWNPDSERRDKIREDIMNRLRKYRHKLAEYHACRDLYNELYPSGTHTLSGMPPAQNDTYEPERWAQRRWDQRLLMQKSLEDMSVAITDVENMVNGLTDAYRAIIVRRYLLGETLEDISGKMNYTERHIRRFHRGAIERLVTNGLQDSDICDHSQSGDGR